MFSANARIRPATPANDLAFREIHYDGTLADEEARFTLDIDAEATARESSALLLEGDVAVLPAKLPDALKIVREGNRYLLVASRPGHFQFKLEVVAKIQREEPWNEISFTGPAATIASVTAQAARHEHGSPIAQRHVAGSRQDQRRFARDRFSRRRSDRRLALARQNHRGRAQGAAHGGFHHHRANHPDRHQIHQPVSLRYRPGQRRAAHAHAARAQALTRLEGDQIRDWHTTAEGDRQTLTIEFIKPVENAYDLTLYSEQAVDSAAANSSLNPPQPLNVERESGSLTVSAEDTLVEIASLAGLRQVNAPDNAVAAYRFNARPFTLALKLKPIEPVVSVTDRVNARLEETRLVISHGLALNVEKAGIYTLELTPQSGIRRGRRARRRRRRLEGERWQAAGEFFRARAGFAPARRAIGTGAQKFSGANQRHAVARDRRSEGNRANWRGFRARHPAEDGHTFRPARNSR